MRGSELALEFKRRAYASQDLRNGYAELKALLEQSLQQIAEQIGQAAGELASAYLPVLEEAAIAQAERLTGFRGFTKRNPLTAMDRERAVLEKTIARIRADERYVRREYLVGPAGELTRALEERRSLAEPWETECRRFEDLDGFLDLVRVGYDTPAFREQFWQPDYWKHWAQGDRICEKLAMNDFGDDVLPKYMELSAEREKWRQQIQEVESRIEAVHELVREHDGCVARIPELPSIYLAQCQEVLAAFLAKAEIPLLDEWLGPPSDETRPMRMVLRRLAGLQAKKAFLGEMLALGVLPLLGSLETRIQKYQRKSTKFYRSKHYSQNFPDYTLEAGFEERALKMASNREKLHRTVLQVVSYEKYERFDLDNDPNLWWVEFTGKKPSRFTPKLREYYDRNPDARPAHVGKSPSEQDDLDMVAAVVGAGTLDEAGYLS